ncbi:MAG: hypothetical protein EBU90_10730 [Proteobacteria bacterium]|nr:hypothetical protein [Pseudomonadota bacterium]
MLDTELDNLLKQSWSEEEMQQLQKLADCLKYYKKLMTKTLKTDLVIALEICNRLKIELEELRKKQSACVCSQNEM